MDDYERVMNLPTVSQADKLALTFERHPERLSAGMRHAFEALAAAEEPLLGQLRSGIPHLAGALERVRSGRPLAEAGATA